MFKKKKAKKRELISRLFTQMYQNNSLYAAFISLESILKSDRRELKN